MKVYYKLRIIRRDGSGVYTTIVSVGFDGPCIRSYIVKFMLASSM